MSSILASKDTAVKQGQKLTQKIVLIKGGSQYDVLRIFVDHLSDAFASLGYEVAMVDLSKADFVEDLKSIKGAIKAFISLNGAGVTLMFKERSLFDTLNVPLVSWFVDHPFYHWERLTHPINQRIVFFSNQNNYDFYTKHLRKPAIVGQCLQLAGCQMNDEILPIQERPHDLVFFGSCLGTLKELEQRLDFGNKVLNDTVFETIEAAKFETQRELYQIFFENMEKIGLPPMELSHEKIAFLVGEMDRYVRTFRRNHVLKSLKDYPITVFGNGWEHFEHRNSNMILKPAMSFPEVLNMMGQSKVVLNIMPNNRTGIHERVAYSMHQGAACLSEAIPGMLSDFEHEKNIFYFQMSPELGETLHTQVSAMFNDLESVQKVASEGKQAVEENHSWVQRAQVILDKLEVHNIAMSLK